MTRICMTLTAAALVALTSGNTCAGAVITFDSLETAGTGSTTIPSYSEAGFDFVSSSASSAAFGYWHQSNGNYAGSAALFNNFGGETTTLTKSGGGTFTLNSLDLSEVYATAEAANVTFIGTKSGGGTVTESIDLDEVFGFETLTFSGFTDLVSVVWEQTPNFHQFDNIVLDGDPVPEPASLAMWGLGALGLVIARRRRRAMNA